ncbi:MAG: TonB-dependent receptor [Acidobacteria bacterium]|nr:TonB-dependent receptor [Acidobacteriota bacterium]
MRRVFLLVALALLATGPSALAQQGTTEVRGVVVDAQGAVLPGVTVTVKNQDTGMYRETASNQDGTYFVTGIAPGRYEISASLEGFKRYSQRDLTLSIGRTATVDVTLEVGALAESITVTGAAPLVDVTSKEVGGNITSRDLTDLPSINGNFVGFVGLLPGVIPTISTESFGSDSITVNGQDPRNNNYTLDGANNNDDVIGQRAGTQARTPIEAIQEFQVITNQFDAEFGRTAGAIVNAVTKQGTNQWRGSAFENYQSAELTAKDFFAKKNDSPKPDTKYHRFGGTLGGPIVRDKAHFFFSLERYLIDEGITVNIPVRPELNTTTTEKTRVWNTVIRFDHQLNAGNTWSVRWLREYSPQFNQIIPAAGLPVSLAASREEDDTDQTVVGSLSSVLSNARVNTLRLAWTQEDVAFANPCFDGNGRNQAGCPPTLTFQDYVDQQSAVAQARVNNGYQIEDTMSWFVPGKRGDHDLKFGLQYQYSSSRNDTQDNLNGTFAFGRSNVPFDPANPRTYPDRLSIRVPGRGGSLNKAHFAGAFAQDKWRWNNKLTLSLGVRYDVEITPIEEVDNPLFDSPDDYPVDWNNIAPRFGFSYDLTGDGRSVLRGGYGLFYDKTHFELIGGIYTNRVFSSSFIRNFPLANVDPGPRNGQRPTDPFLVNGPVVNRDLLAQLFPPGATIRNTGASWDNPDRRLPYSQQFTAGFERQFGAAVSASVDYVHSMARDLLMARDLNPGLRATTAVTSPLVRQGSDELRGAVAELAATYPGFANFTTGVTIPVNAGSTDYDALMFQLEKRFSHNYSARVAYTLSYSRGNTSGFGVPASPFQVLDDLNLDLNEGPSNQDQRHNLVISGQALVPRTGGLTVSWVARALSGTPFSLFNSTIDSDRNGTQAEPLPAGSYSGTGSDAFTVEDYRSERNGARGPGFFKLDLRLGYRLKVGGPDRTLDLFADVFNVTDRVNYANPSGNQASTLFLVLTGYSTSTTPRTLQVGVRYGF